MKRMEGYRMRRARTAILLGLVLLPVQLRAQGGDAVVPVALEPATGELVPVRLDLIRRWDVRLDPATGTLIATAPGGEGPPALLAMDPTTRTLFAAGLVPTGIPGRIDVDPRSGVPTAEGLDIRMPGPGGPVLVGYDPASGVLAPMEIAFRRQPGTFALDPRVGILSPPPGGPAVMAYDPSTGSMAPVEVAAVHGGGTLEIESSGRISLHPAGTVPDAGALRPLGISADGSSLVPADLEIAYRPGLISLDPGTGRFSVPPEQAVADGLTMMGVHYPTGALMRGHVESTRGPGTLRVDLLAGTVEQFAVEPPPESEPAGGFLFGGGFDLRQMLNLQDVLAEGGVGGTGASATELAPGIHGFAEYRWHVISFGVEAAYSVMDTEIRFPQGLQTGDLTYFEIGGNVKVFVPLDVPVSPYATFTVVRATSEGDFELEELTESRTYEAKRDGIGAGLEYWATPQWGFRFEGLYNTTFEDSDAAEHIRWRAGVTYSPLGIGGRRDGN